MPGNIWSQFGSYILPFIDIIPSLTMKSGRVQLSRRKKLEGDYEEAMNQAFTEIFRNLKEIKEDTDKQRKKVNLERRRVSHPVMTLKETRTDFQQSENELKRNLSPVSTSSLPTMHWVLPCYDEDDEDIEPVDFNFGVFGNLRESQFNKS